VGGGGEGEEGCCVGLEEGGSAGLVWDSPCGVQRAELIVPLSEPMGGHGSVVQVSWGRRWTEMLLAQLAAVDIPFCDGFLTTGL